MANLCDDCAIYDKCMKEKIYMECVDNDFDSYVSPHFNCDGCFYETWAKLSMLSPCYKCIRQPVSYRTDNYVAKDEEREAYND